LAHASDDLVSHRDPRHAKLALEGDQAHVASWRSQQPRHHQVKRDVDLLPNQGDAVLFKPSRVVANPDDNIHWLRFVSFWARQHLDEHPRGFLPGQCSQEDREDEP
jgi:hypothetical protein